MVILANSTGSRTGETSPKGHVLVDYRGPRNAVDSAGIYMRFDIGTPNKREFVRVDIEPEDFPALMAEMLSCNRRVFLDAVAKALLAHPE